MLLRGLGAMNGLRGGTGPPSTGFGTAVPPSNCGTDDRCRSGIGTTGAPGICAAALTGMANRATTIKVATTAPALAPQAPWRMRRRAYGRLVRNGAEAARADPRSEFPHQPLHAGLPRRRERRADLLQRGGRRPARDLIRGAGPH